MRQKSGVSKPDSHSRPLMSGLNIHGYLHRSTVGPGTRSRLCDINASEATNRTKKNRKDTSKEDLRQQVMVVLPAALHSSTKSI